MKTASLLLIILAILTPVAAQQQNKTEPVKSFDLLYSDIMNNLPTDMKSKVDSAKLQSSMMQSEKNKDRKGNCQKECSTPGTQSVKLDDVPDHLKEQVQKALEQIENNNRCKNLEFMDNLKNMKCHR